MPFLEPQTPPPRVETPQVQVVPSKPGTTEPDGEARLSDQDLILATRVRQMLIQHLGSDRAADAWLNDPNTGYPTTAMDAIRQGKEDLVLEDLESQWGPSPPYA